MSGTRPIPDALKPVTDQAILNLALSGCRITNQGGIDVTDLCLAYAEDTNAAYDKFLNDYRRATAMPESSAAQTARRTVTRVQR